jgi:hypothetical protein
VQLSYELLRRAREAREPLNHETPAIWRWTVGPGLLAPPRLTDPAHDALTRWRRAREHAASEEGGRSWPPGAPSTERNNVEGARPQRDPPSRS